MDADEEPLFFIAALICVICGQFWIGLRQAALGFFGLFAPFCGKSSQVAFYQQLTTNAGFSNEG